MASARVSKGRVPVFVFLDENVSCAKFEKLKNANVPSKYQLKIIPFPLVMDCLGIFDFQVVLFLQKMVTSHFYGIRQMLHRHPRPIFFFVTQDLTFIKDAEKGFENWKGNKKRGHQNRNVRFYFDSINSAKDTIIIRRDNDYPVHIFVKYIKGGENDTQQTVISKILKLLEEFLV